MANRFQNSLAGSRSCRFLPKRWRGSPTGMCAGRVEQKQLRRHCRWVQKLPRRYQPLTAFLVISRLQSRARLAVFRWVHSSTGSLPDRQVWNNQQWVKRVPGVGDGLHGLSCGQAASWQILYDDEQRTAVRQKLSHLMRTAVKSDFCYLLTLSHPWKAFE